jgi:hypothetical protein
MAELFYLSQIRGSKLQNRVRYLEPPVRYILSNISHNFWHIKHFIIWAWVTFTMYAWPCALVIYYNFLDLRMPVCIVFFAVASIIMLINLI